MNKKIDKYILIYPESHLHLGLFRDLENLPNVSVYVISSKKTNSTFVSRLKKVHNSGFLNRFIKLPCRQIWFDKPQLHIDEKIQYRIIFVDAAIKAYTNSELNQLLSAKNVKGALVLLNSMDAQSAAIVDIRSRIFKINWDEIYTFDPKDAKKYDFHYLGCCYYSRKPEIEIKKEDMESSAADVYFIGGLKGNRKQLILDVFEKCYENGVSANFQIMLSGFSRMQKQPHSNYIHYFTGGWIPYSKILCQVLKSNVIVEVLQEGQSGPSLRYYESICYNRKLITNNTKIVDLPFYDDRYMRVFRTADDIDIDWIRKKEEIHYCYHDEFSPTHMLDIFKTMGE